MRGASAVPCRIVVGFELGPFSPSQPWNENAAASDRRVGHPAVLAHRAPDRRRAAAARPW